MNEGGVIGWVARVCRRPHVDRVRVEGIVNEGGGVEMGIVKRGRVDKKEG